MATCNIGTIVSRKRTIRVLVVLIVIILVFNRAYFTDEVLSRLPISPYYRPHVVSHNEPTSVRPHPGSLVDSIQPSSSSYAKSNTNSHITTKKTITSEKQQEEEQKLETRKSTVKQSDNTHNETIKVKATNSESLRSKIDFPKSTTNLKKKPNNLVPAQGETCPFPKMDPFNPSVRKFILKIPTINCSAGVPSLVYRDGEVLKFNETKAKILNVTTDHCRYSPLYMQKGSDHYAEKPNWSLPFHSFVKLPEFFENIVIECTYKKKVVSQTLSTIIRVRNTTEEKCQSRYKEHIRKNSPKETMSVLLVGIDGISRGNFIRSMPKTRKFILEQMGAMELRKMNKVGDNTLPNLAALLAGSTMNQLRENFSMANEYFDKVDHKFIWKNFSDAGYRIGFMIDRAFISAFHYQKKGWNKHIFDYHHRPAVTWWDKNRATRKASEWCVGQTPEVNHLFDFWLQLATLFNNSRTQPYFGYSFFCHLTHDDPNLATAGDDLYLDFFQKLKQRNVLDNTIIVFFSDHGARFGPFRFTYHGLLETRNPMLFFIFPEWFKKKYPDIMDNFRINQDRLTTHFDVHATLKDILNFTGKVKKAKVTDKGISLFNELPVNRTCGFAGISMNYCLCSQRSTIEAPMSLWEGMGLKMFQVIVNQTAKYRDICYRLKLVRIKTVVTLKDTHNRKHLQFYRAIIETAPGGAVYEGLLEYRIKEKRIRSAAMPTRLTMYRGQAECVEEELVRPFCVCKDRVSVAPQR